MSGLQTILDTIGMSRAELGRRVGVSRTSIDKACNLGDKGLSMQSLGAVARELSELTGRTPGDILEQVVMPAALPPPT